MARKDDLFGIDSFSRNLDKQNREMAKSLSANPWQPPKKQSERDSRRKFTSNQQKHIWSQQNGKCASCKQQLDPLITEYDHVKPWADKGKTIVENGAALCLNCHRKKTRTESLKKIESRRKKKVGGRSHPLS